jgi:hypothetical protein
MTPTLAPPQKRRRAAEALHDEVHGCGAREHGSVFQFQFLVSVPGRSFLSVSRLKLDLGSKFYNPLGRYLEVGCRADGITGHESVELLAP